MKQEREFNMGPNLNTNLQNNENVQENNEQEDELDNDMEDFESEYQANDSSDDYGSSGEKYAWYNGFSDDAIDDAFEGDRENTWNVD